VSLWRPRLLAEAKEKKPAPRPLQGMGQAGTLAKTTKIKVST
jgi:hypothetical protein